jgi:PAS domain S-box-containing protein
MSDETYKNLFENVSAAMLIIQPESGRIIDANKAASKYYGFTKQQLTNMRIEQINILSRAQIFDEMQNAKRQKRNYFNFQHRLANGDIRDVEVFSGPLTIGQEEVLCSIIHDISERKRVEQQIRIEKGFSESLISSLPGIMYVFDKLGRFIRWNHNFEIVSGYTADQIKTMGPLDFISIADTPRVRKAIQDVYAQGYVTIEAEFATIDGNNIPYLLTGYKFDQQELELLVGIGIDISQRLKVEKEKENLIQKLQESLAQVKKLSGMLPICAACKNIRDDKGYWKRIEVYIQQHSEAEFSHSLCPDCIKKLYPELAERLEKK